MQTLMLYASYATYALACYLPVALSLRAAMNYRAREIYNSDELIGGGNLAVATRRGGAHLGLAIAMVGVASGSTNPNFLLDLVSMLAYGLLAAAFMISSMLVTDKLILPGVDNTAEIRDGNLAVGVVEFGALVMTGIIAYASIHGDQGTWLASLVYFVAGQASLVGMILIYEKLFASYQLVERVNRGEMAAGIYLSSKLIAYGLILQSAIIGPTQAGGSAIISFLVAAAGGMALLFVFEWVIDKLFVTSTDVKDILEKNQVSAAIQLALPKMGMALFLGLAML